MQSRLKFAIYHGDEEWVLKGIGQDLAVMERINPRLLLILISIQTTDRVFDRVRLDADYHIFVQQVN